MKHLYSINNKLAIKQLDNEYTLLTNNRLKNNNIDKSSTGFYIGKFLVHFIGRVAMLIAASCTGPASPAAYLALEATFAKQLEALSNIVGLGCGIAACLKLF